MEDKLKNTGQLENSTEKVKPNKRKKRVKRILIVLWLIVWFLLLSLLGIFLYMTYGDVPWKCHCYDNPSYDPNYDCSQEFNDNDAFSKYCVDEHKKKQHCHCLAKPIIYLYPTIEAQLNVKLWTPENLLHTYPKYNIEKWRNVIAQPNWDLEDMDTWRKLYALYREWKSDNETNFNEWFVVKWEDIIPFLEEKLAILWLNERESEEFIIYWLPQMENNEYNLIRFETMEEQNENMPLNITPTPDTIIRVMMDWKAIDEPINIPEQKLETPERIWFTVVEWWGSPRN